MRLVTVVAAVVMLSAAAEAADDGFLDGAHWNGTVRIVDATANPRVLEALRTFKAEWNAMRSTASLGALPAVEVTTARPEACTTARLREDLVRAGRVYGCGDNALANAAVRGPYLFDAEIHTTVGLVKLRPRTLSWAECNLRTAVAHELGHVMGLAHNDAGALRGGPSVMMSGKGPYGRGCPAWFNAHDRQALRILYDEHVRTEALLASRGKQSVD